MSSEWTTTSLGEAADLVTGFPFKSADFSQEPLGPRLVRGASVGIGELLDQPPFLPKEKVTDDLSAYSLRKDDVVLAMDGTWTARGMKWFRVRSEHLPALLVQRVARLRAQPGYDQHFIGYLVASPGFATYIRGVETGTTISHISPTQIKGYQFSRPPLDDQRRIAGVLAALDDKIEHNGRLLVCLLEAARQLYRLGPLAPVAVADIAELQKGLSYKGAGLVEAGGLPMFNLGNFTTSGWCSREGLKFYQGEHKERHQVGPDDLLVANTDLTQRREILGQPLLVPSSIPDGLFTHHVYAVRFKETFGRYRFGLYFGLQTRGFRDRAETFATGTTVAALPKDALLDFECPLPVDADAFNQQVEPLISRCWALEDESVSLKKVRGALLPKLVSGQLRVPVSYDPNDVLGTLSEKATATA